MRAFLFDHMINTRIYLLWCHNVHCSWNRYVMWARWVLALLSKLTAVWDTHDSCTLHGALPCLSLRGVKSLSACMVSCKRTKLGSHALYSLSLSCSRTHIHHVNFQLLLLSIILLRGCEAPQLPPRDPHVCGQLCSSAELTQACPIGHTRTCLSSYSSCYSHS